MPGGRGAERVEYRPEGGRRGTDGGGGGGGRNGSNYGGEDPAGFAGFSVPTPQPLNPEPSISNFPN